MNVKTSQAVPRFENCPIATPPNAAENPSPMSVKWVRGNSEGVNSYIPRARPAISIDVASVLKTGWAAGLLIPLYLVLLSLGTAHPHRSAD